MAKTVYAVRAVPVRDVDGANAGWVRADVLADGSNPTDRIFLRDGTSCGQAQAMERVARDLALLFPTRAEAVDDGIARLREADRMTLRSESRGTRKP